MIRMKDDGTTLQQDTGTEGNALGFRKYRTAIEISGCVVGGRRRGESLD